MPSERTRIVSAASYTMRTKSRERNTWNHMTFFFPMHCNREGAEVYRVIDTPQGGEDKAARLASEAAAGRTLELHGQWWS